MSIRVNTVYISIYIYIYIQAALSIQNSVSQLYYSYYYLYLYLYLYLSRPKRFPKALPSLVFREYQVYSILQNAPRISFFSYRLVTLFSCYSCCSAEPRDRSRQFQQRCLLWQAIALVLISSIQLAIALINFSNVPCTETLILSLAYTLLRSALLISLTSQPFERSLTYTALSGSSVLFKPLSLCRLSPVA